MKINMIDLKEEAKGVKGLIPEYDYSVRISLHIKGKDRHANFYVNKNDPITFSLGLKQAGEQFLDQLKQRG